MFAVCVEYILYRCMYVCAEHKHVSAKNCVCVLANFQPKIPETVNLRRQEDYLAQLS